MSSYFETVIQFDVFHSFYNDNRCKDLIVEPTSECALLLRRFRLLFKKTLSGMVVIGEKRNIGTEAVPVLVPFIDIPPREKFYFTITSLRDDFLNITDADMEALAGGKKFYLQNSMVAPVVNGNVATFTVHNNTPLIRAVELGSTAFYAPVLIAEDPVKLRLLNADRITVTEITVPRNSASEITAETLLMTDADLPEGLYTLEQIDATAAITSSREYFLTDPKPGKRILGILCVDYNHFVELHQDKEVRMETYLANRAVRWVYRVEIEKYKEPAEVPFTYQAANIFLNNNTNTVPSVGSAFTKTILIPPDPNDNVKIRFRSNNLIPIRESPYKDVRLMNSGLSLIDHLPTPLPAMMKFAGGNYETEIFLKIK
jgi:hypothetical protein